MYSLKFDKNRCLDCESLECLLECQYLRLDHETAKKEKIKMLNGEGSFVLSDCATCYACEEYCPYGNHPFFQIVELQESKGIYTAPIPITNQQIKMAAPKGNPEVKKILTDPTFSLCIFPDMSNSIKGPLFEGVSSFLGLNFFCNLVYLHFAKSSIIKERLPKIIESIWHNLQKNSLDRLFYFHDECYAAFTYWASAYGIHVPFKPVHLFEYLANKLKVLKNHIKPLGVKVAYQRPCSNRLIPETDLMLDGIFDLIGVERVDRCYDRQNALCCGSVMMMMGRYELADDVQERNVEDMVAAGVKYCVFNCPFCYYTLSDLVKNRGLIPIMIVDLCHKALEATDINS